MKKETFYKTIFHVKEMDCPSEEQMIRMKLADLTSVKNLSFDLAKRMLTVFHEGDYGDIERSLDSLSLGTKFVETSAYVEKNPENQKNQKNQADDQADRKMLWQVFVINFSFFLIEAFTGLVANSMGLVADSVDMLADALVYAMSLYAISGTILVKKKIARFSGLFQAILGIGGFFEVVRRFISSESFPEPVTMMVVSFFALVANTVSLVILKKSKNDEAHIQASQVFTSNDVIANIGVIVAGALVFTWNSHLPDLVVGLFVFVYVLRGAWRILKLAK